ncbi:MAG: hypothetical protein QOD63_2266, partial [Actinomycetota bacterium]|nr:hypothetical protein [Actinomycetota bacterium]
PSGIALRFADLYQRLSTTPQVDEPSSKFDPENPPPVKATGQKTQPAGLVMVTDMLWAGSGGHPWDGIDEFFASALGGFLHNPKLLGQIAAHYVKGVGGNLGDLCKELFVLLGQVAKGGAGKAAPLADSRATAAAKALAAIGSVPDWSQKQIPLLQPDTLPGPNKPTCPRR